MPSSITSASTTTSRRPSTAPQALHPRISTPYRFRPLPPIPYGSLSRAKVVNLPGLGTEERSFEYLVNSDLSPTTLRGQADTPRTRAGDQDSSRTVGKQGINASLKSTSPVRTQTEWKYLHDRHVESQSTSKGRLNGSTQVDAKPMNIDDGHYFMSNSPPPAYSSLVALDTSLESDVPVESQQEVTQVEVGHRRGSTTTHTVPVLRQHYPAATGRSEASASNGGQRSRPATMTASTSDTSGRSEGLSLTGRIGRGARRIFHPHQNDGVDPPPPAPRPPRLPRPPRPPRSGNRPSTADATLQSLSTSSTAASHLSAPAFDIAHQAPPLLHTAVENGTSPAAVAPPLPILQPVHDREPGHGIPTVNATHEAPQIRHLATENGTSPPSVAPPPPILQPVHEREPDHATPISSIDLNYPRTTSPLEPSSDTVMPPSSPQSSRWTYGTAPSRENVHPDGTPEFDYSGEAFPLGLLHSRQSASPPSHSRASEGMIARHVASNLQVEAEDDTGIHLGAPYITRSPDLAPWYASFSPSPSVDPARDVESSSSSNSNSADSRRPLRPATASSPTLQRGLANFPHFGGNSPSGRSQSSRSPANAQRITAEGDLTGLHINAPEASPTDLPTAHASHSSRVTPTSRPSSPSAERGDETRPRRLDNPSETHGRTARTPIYHPVTPASFASSGKSDQDIDRVGSSAGIRSPGSWSNSPLRLSRRSTRHGSDAHEQLLTPKSVYSPSLKSQHDDHVSREASPFPLSRPRSPNVLSRNLGSGDSGPSSQGYEQDQSAHMEPENKQGLEPSATLATMSSTSQYSSFHSFASDTRLVETKDISKSASTARPSVAGPQGTTFSANKLFAATEQFEKLSVSERMERAKNPPRVPASYLNYKPDSDDDLYGTLTLPSPIPGASTGVTFPKEPTTSTIQQSLNLEVTRAPDVIAQSPKKELQQVHAQENTLGVGLGILVPEDSPHSQDENAGAPSTIRDRILGPIDRILAGKVKEKKKDAQDHLRNQKEWIFRHRSTLPAAKAEGLRGFRPRRRSFQPRFLGNNPITESPAEARRDPAESQSEPPEERMPASFQSKRREPERTPSSLYYVQQPDVLSTQSPQQSPVIPTEPPKRKSFVKLKRVFSKDGIFRFIRHQAQSQSDQALPAPPERVRESYEVQQERLLAAAAEMAKPVHEQLRMMGGELRTSGRDDIPEVAETDALMRNPPSAKSSLTSPGQKSSLRGSNEAIRQSTITTTSGIGTSTSFQSPSLFQASSIKTAEDAGAPTTPQRKSQATSISARGNEDTDDITPTQKIRKQSPSEGATKPGMSDREKLAAEMRAEMKRRQRLEAYSSTRMQAVYSGQVITPPSQTSEPATSESSSQEISSGEERIAELRVELRDARAAQAERQRNRNAGHTRPSGNDGPN